MKVINHCMHVYYPNDRIWNSIIATLQRNLSCNMIGACNQFLRHKDVRCPFTQRVYILLSCSLYLKTILDEVNFIVINASCLLQCSAWQRMCNVPIILAGPTRQEGQAPERMLGRCRAGRQSCA